MEIKGLKIAGYRYGKAPKSGYSWNYRDNESECGVSMASVGYAKEKNSFAVSDLRSKKVKKYYYIGVVAGTGGDDEICLKNTKQISYKEYLNLKKEYIKEINEIINYFYDGKISLIKKGWNIGSTIDELENERNKQLK